jgi:integrase
MTDIIPTRPAPDAGALAHYREDVLNFARASQAANTRRAYRSAWGAFCAWCAAHGAAPLPAEPATVAAWLTDQAHAGQKVATLNVKRAAVCAAHRTAGQADPTRAELVRLTMRGITRTLRAAPTKKAPVTLAELRAMLATLDRSTLPGRRDAALLLVGYAGAFRRSELVALDVEDVRFTADGLRLTVRQSKTDQEGRGLLKVIPYQADPALCPVTALRAWLDAAGINSGPLLRRLERWGGVRARLTDQAVKDVVKRCASLAGLDPRQFAGHSLRAGFVTAAAVAGVQAIDIAAQTGHKSLDSLKGYIRDAGFGNKRAVAGAFMPS